MLLTTFHIIWPSGFRGKAVLESTNKKQELPNGSGRNEQSQQIPTKLRIIWQNSFRGEESKKSAKQKQESPVAAMFVNGLGRNEQSL